MCDFYITASWLMPRRGRPRKKVGVVELEKMVIWRGDGICSFEDETCDVPSPRILNFEVIVDALCHGLIIHLNLHPCGLANFPWKPLIFFASKPLRIDLDLMEGYVSKLILKESFWERGHKEALENAFYIVLWTLGYNLYQSISSMDGGDSFDPTVNIAHSKFSIQMFEIFASVELCGTL